MKLNKLVTFLLLVLTITACKNEGNDGKKNSEVKKEEAVESVFTVTLDLIARKDDNMHLYYTEDSSINFDEVKSVWAQIKGNESTQQVIFKLPLNAVPTHLRLDLGYGKNVEQTEIVLNKISFNYFDKNFVASGQDIFNYFYPNKDNTILDKQTGSLKRLKIDQETAPSLYPHTTLEEELIKLTR